MRVGVISVGRPRGIIAEAIAAYEKRLAHYFTFAAIEVREQPFRPSGGAALVREEEGARLLARVPAGCEMIALEETGRKWSSVELATHLAEAPGRGSHGTVFLVGGAYGLSDAVLSAASHRLSLSAMTLPHELARLVLTEQLYRAGTLSRGEPYHKGRE